MEASVKKAADAAVVSVKGRIDATSAGDVQRVLAEVLAQGETALVVNFDEVDYVSSAGLRIILATAKQLRARSGEMRFAGLKGPVREVFEISGFLSLFKCFDDEEAAIRGSV